jgi:hypothetical protein
MSHRSFPAKVEALASIMPHWEWESPRNRQNTRTRRRTGFLATKARKDRKEMTFTTNRTTRIARMNANRPIYVTPRRLVGAVSRVSKPARQTDLPTSLNHHMLPIRKSAIQPRQDRGRPVWKPALRPQSGGPKARINGARICDPQQPRFPLTANHAKYANKDPGCGRTLPNSALRTPNSELCIGMTTDRISNFGFRFSSCRVEAASAKTDRISDFGFRILPWSSLLALHSPLSALRIATTLDFGRVFSHGCTQINTDRTFHRRQQRQQRTARASLILKDQRSEIP